MSATHEWPFVPSRASGLPEEGGWYRSSHGWRRRLAEFLPRALARRREGEVCLRVLTPDRLRRRHAETLLRAAERLAPGGVPVKLYLLPQSHSLLFDLTCCLPSGGCATVTIHRALLSQADRAGELAQRMEELFSRCQAHASRA